MLIGISSFIITAIFGVLLGLFDSEPVESRILWLSMLFILSVGLTYSDVKELRETSIKLINEKK
jgi:VIT1/CCC1 family predicted Fe2+/Mn2+ transporter